MQPLSSLKGQKVDDLVKEVATLRSKLSQTEQKLKAETENGEALRQSLAELRAQLKLRSEATPTTTRLAEATAQLRLNSEVLKTNIASFESRKAVTDDLKEVIKTQEAEIERLKVYKNELFEVKKRNIELLGQLGAQKAPGASLASEKKLRGELAAAEEAQKKWKRRAAQTYDESLKALEKINNRFLELELRLKNLASKQHIIEKRLSGFERAKEKFSKIIRFCFQRMDDVTDLVVNGSRKIMFGLRARADARNQSLRDLAEEYRYVNGKLEEYHTIIGEIGKAGQIDFNNQGLQQIYQSLRVRKDITDAAVQVLRKARGALLTEEETLGALAKVAGVHWAGCEWSVSRSLTIHISGSE